MTNGRRKGAAAEVEVARLVQAWWRQLPTEAQMVPDGGESEFVRTPMSGGWSTKRVRGNFRASGDLSSTSDAWPFCVEVKRREGWSLTMFAKAGKRGSPVWQWWGQCVRGADEEGAIPMLWVRRNRTPWIVMVPDALGRRVMGSAYADLSWGAPEIVAAHNPASVHPIGYLAEKILASDPQKWIDECGFVPRRAITDPG